MSGIANIQSPELLGDKALEEVPNVVKLIIDHLPQFPTSSAFRKITRGKKGSKGKKNETQYSDAFAEYMTQFGKDKYTFRTEVAQVGSSKIDIGIRFSHELIYTIEGKILPTPNGTKSKPRDEHEYVYRDKGSGAGIERFKQGKHGVDDAEEPLLQNGMLAYVKEQGFDHWLGQVNQWVEDAGWGESEKLTATEHRFVFHSEHQREKTSMAVMLDHFWMCLPAES